ncbi:MAG: RNA polymerase sigma factor [Candidatus Eremiobacteraeota bacterium]|nr:RNA polymerase sigma factor [Candidatus Eremiobacteraeota bacterium]
MDGEDVDRELVEKAKKGDHGAFSALMDRYYRTVLNVVHRFYGCTADEAEDVAQEVFMRIYRSLARFEGRSQFFTWLYKVTMNLCLKKREQRKRREWTSLEEVQEKPPRGEERDPVEAGYGKEELAKVVQEALSTLPEEQRSVVILHRYHDLPYEEIAKILNITLPAVKSRLHRAKLSLRQMLAPYVEG